MIYAFLCRFVFGYTERRKIYRIGVLDTVFLECEFLVFSWKIIIFSATQMPSKEKKKLSLIDPWCFHVYVWLPFSIPTTTRTQGQHTRFLFRIFSESSRLGDDNGSEGLIFSVYFPSKLLAANTEFTREKFSTSFTSFYHTMTSITCRFFCEISMNETQFPLASHAISLNCDAGKSACHQHTSKGWNHLKALTHLTSFSPFDQKSKANAEACPVHLTYFFSLFFPSFHISLSLNPSTNHQLTKKNTKKTI